MGGYTGGGGHYSKYTQQVSFREPGQTPGEKQYVSQPFGGRHKKIPKVFPPLKKRQGSGLAQSDFEKASEFNGQFTDVFTKSEHSQVPLLDRSAPFMEDIVVTKEGVIKLLKGRNPSKA